MTFKITKRAIIRIVSFAVAIILVSSLLIYNYATETQQSRRTLQNHYMQSVDNLSTYAQNINSDLTKILYAKTPALLSQLSAQVWRETGFAKDALDTLPIEYLKLQNTNKLLSQVGDYCVSLSKSFSQGQPITKENRQNLEKLSGYCDTMLRDIITVADSLKTGSINLTKVSKSIKNNFNEQPATPTVAEGFADLEEGFTAYPTLIYDGPFSDNIMQKEPERLKGESNVSRGKAKEKAAKVAMMNIGELKDLSDEDSRMPSYRFGNDKVDTSITKQGGLISYMLKSRLVSDAKLTTAQAQDKARTYMDSLGIGVLESSYYEISNNIATFNYAYKQDDIVIYTDLIKVGVALDNGEIMSFDARGYIVNHKKRDIKTPKYNKEDCMESVSDFLQIEKSRLVVIPSGGLSEVLCYEYKCRTQDKKDILVYVNANTRIEEQILILLISDNGVLTL